MNNKKIIIIDDDKDFQNFIALNLKKHDYKIIASENGTDGLKKIHSEKPDLIVIDYEMPDMNGLKFLEKLDAEGIQTPIIWVSGTSSPEIYQQAWQFGIYEFFQKPIPIDKFLHCIDSAFEDFTEKDISIQKQLSFKVSTDTYSKIQIYCKKNKTSLSELFEKFVEKTF